MWTSVNNIDRLFGAMDLLNSKISRVFPDFDKYDGGRYGLRLADGTPRTNLYDNADYLEIRAEVPGMLKDDINIKIQGNYLEISGTRKSDTPEAYKANRVERNTVSFTRSLTLPLDVDVEKVEAALNNGILTLTLPKAEAAKPKQIAIQ